MRFRYTPIRMAKINMTKPNADKDAEKLDHLYVASGNVKCTVILKYSLAVSYKTKHQLPYNPAIVPLAMNPRKIKIYVHTKTCTQVFIATLLVIAKNWIFDLTSFSW